MTGFALSTHPDGTDPERTALAETTRQLGEYVSALGAALAAVNRRLSALEENERAVTLSHAEVLRIQGMIRARAAEYGSKYALGDPESIRAFRGAIKKAILARYGVRDLHDVPAIARPGAEALITVWSDIRLVMKRRGSGGP